MSADGMVHADDGTEDASRVTASAYTRQDATLWRLSVSLVSKKQRYINTAEVAIWIPYAYGYLVPARL